MNLPFECDPKDPQDQTLDLVSKCACGCGESIYRFDEDVRRYDGDYFVNADHFADWYGVERMDLIWS